MTVEEMERELIKLDEESRSRIYYFLMDLMDDTFEIDMPQKEIEAAWDRECERRIAELDNGTAKTYPADEVHAYARAKAAEKALLYARELTV
jgi:hypothetical protein